MSSEQTKKRNRNRYAILRAVQTHGPLKRSEIARICGIRKSSITGLVGELIEADVLCAKVPERPRSPLVFTTGEWFAVVAAIEEGELCFARVDLFGKIFDQTVTALSDQSYQAVEDALVTGLEKMLAINSDRVLGVGVSIPGIVDAKLGVSRCSINTPYLNGRPIGESLKKRLGVDVVIENDVRAGLWAGIWFEHFLASYNDVLYLEIAQGVGSALLINGKPHIGATFAAGEMGHMRAGSENRACCCGKQDCLETYASIDAIRKDILSIAPHLGPTLTAGDIAEASEDNQVVVNILDRAMEYLSTVLSVLVAYIDPDVILLGNQDPRFYEVVAPLIEKHMLVRLQGHYRTDIDIQVVPSAKHSALRGVAGLVIDQACQTTFNS